MNKTAAIIISIVLFLGVIFQALVIVDYHSDDFRLGFFRQRTEPVVYFESFDESIAEQYFKPFSIYVNDGEQSWVMRNDEDFFDTLWQDGKNLITDGLLDELEESDESWASVSRNPGVLFKFGYPLPINYLGFILSMEFDDTVPPDIEKILVVPSEEAMDVYVKGRNRVYEARGLEATGLFLQPNFEGFADLLGVEPSYSSDSYREIHNFISEDVLDEYIEPDILVVLDTNPRTLPWLELSVPGLIKEYNDALKIRNEAERETAVEEVGNKIRNDVLGRTVNTFEMHIDLSEKLYFSNQFNIYEISRTGWIRYRYTEGTEGDEKGNIGDAFINAVETLSALTELSENSHNLYLSGITEDDETYTFTFDYRYGQSVIAFTENDHAAVITGTATRTIEALVCPLNIDENIGEEKVSAGYILNFPYITQMNDVNIINIEAYEMYVGYMKTEAMLEVVSPVWLIEKRTGEKQVLYLIGAEE